MQKIEQNEFIELRASYTTTNSPKHLLIYAQTNQTNWTLIHNRPTCVQDSPRGSMHSIYLLPDKLYILIA